MKPVKLGNEKALQLTNNLLIGELQNKINTSYNIDIEYKRYHFLDKNRATELKQKEHSFVLNTFGTKYLLFLTYVNFKPYAIYINRKNNTFFLVKTRFSLELYDDTILEGETIKIDEKWFFLVGDCLIYRGEQLMLKSFSYRSDIITMIINDNYVSDHYLEPFTLLKKDIFQYKDIQNVKNQYIPALPFKVNGYVFKCENNSSYDILYIFPECRNKTSVLKNDSDSDKSRSASPVRSKLDKTEERREFADTPKNEKKVLEKDEATFLMKNTEYPDVYEIFIFDKQKDKKAKVGYAGILNIQTSVMVRKWFESKTEVYARFKRHQINDKWIPQNIIE